jgi:hypothetical protein
MRISDEHVNHWRRHGYTVVDRFLSPAELFALQGEVVTVCPTWDDYVADQNSTAPQYYSPGGGYGGYFVSAPATGGQLNLAGAHPDLIDLVERLLGTRDIILTQSQLWGKYNSGKEDFDQSLHADYMNQSILYPSQAGDPEQVTAILYYVDIGLDLGPTYVVSRDLTENVPLVPYIRSRRQYPALYALETPVLVRAGSILLIDLRTFHRGSAITRSRGVRFSHHFAYRRADAHWAGCRYWANDGLTEDWQMLIEAASPRQREMFGVPPPAHPYWNAETVAGMAARYPNMDVRPYAEAAGVSQSLIDAERERMKNLPPTSDITSSTGVGTRIGCIRQSIRAMRAAAPTIAAYYEGILDAYEAASTGR